MDEAFEATKKAAENGDVNAMLKMADLCLSCLKDTTGAFEWHTKAAHAEPPHSHAMYMLGQWYWNMTEDKEAAVEWLTKAAEANPQKNFEAMRQLGHCYRCLGNLAASDKWYKAACDAFVADGDDDQATHKGDDGASPAKKQCKRS